MHLNDLIRKVNKANTKTTFPIKLTAKAKSTLLKILKKQGESIKIAPSSTQLIIRAEKRLKLQ